MSGSVADRQRSATTRPAVARGAAGHLWKLPVQKSAPSAAGCVDQPWSMRAVDDDRDTAVVAHLDQRCDREDHRGRRADLIHDEGGGVVQVGREQRDHGRVVGLQGTSTMTTSAWFSRAKRSAAYRTAP